jgi:hypothetical protein
MHWKQIEKLPGIVLNAFQSAGQAILDAILWPFKEAGKLIGHIPIIGKLLEKGLGAITHPGGILHAAGHLLSGIFQQGGPVTSTGAYLVGERGPEVVTLPAGAYVTPNSALGDQGGMLTLVNAIRDLAQRPIIIQNVLDGRMLSQSIVRQGLLQTARGG